MLRLNLDSLPEETKKSLRGYVPAMLVPLSFLRPLGYLTIWASRLEAAIDITIMRFLAVDDVNKGLAVTARLNTLGTKMDFLKVLADLAIENPKARSTFNKICADGGDEDHLQGTG